MPKDRREHLLLLARAAAELPGANRRRAVAGLIHERFRQEMEAAFRGDAPDIPCTVEEIILSAYPTTNHYWRAWLNGKLSRDELIDRLAEASAVSEIDFQRRCRLLREVLAACPLDIDKSAAAVGALWLAEHPDTGGLLDPSLLAYLAPPDTAAAPLRPRPPAPEDPPSDPLPPTPAELAIVKEAATVGEETAPTDAKPDWQALYAARVTKEHAPTVAEDRAHATKHGIPQKQIEQQRRDNTDPRLHTRGRRPRRK